MGKFCATHIEGRSNIELAMRKAQLEERERKQGRLTPGLERELHRVNTLLSKRKHQAKHDLDKKLEGLSKQLQGKQE